MNRCHPPQSPPALRRRQATLSRPATGPATGPATRIVARLLCVCAAASLLHAAFAQDRTPTLLPSQGLKAPGTQPALRQFPANALGGVMEVKNPPIVMINGTQEQLSPGARIRGRDNSLVMSGLLVGRRLSVNYVRNPQGQVHEVWILTAAETVEKRPGNGPVTNFGFSSDASKGKVDDGKTPFDQLPKYKPQ